MKTYIHLLVDEIVVQDDEAIIRGSYRMLAHALHQMNVDSVKQVPTFMGDWRARRESNPRPLASETNTLSS